MCVCVCVYTHVCVCMYIEYFAYIIMLVCVHVYRCQEVLVCLCCFARLSCSSLTYKQGGTPVSEKSVSYDGRSMLFLVTQVSFRVCVNGVAVSRLASNHADHMCGLTLCVCVCVCVRPVSCMFDVAGYQPVRVILSTHLCLATLDTIAHSCRVVTATISFLEVHTCHSLIKKFTVPLVHVVSTCLT